MSPREMGGPSPDDMGFRMPKRPTEEDFGEIMRRFSSKAARDPESFRGTARDIEDLAEGYGDPDVRKKYYPGWTNADFAEVSKRIKAFGLA